MSHLVFGFFILAVGFLVLLGAAGIRARGPSAGGTIGRALGLGLVGLGAFVLLTSAVVVIQPGQVGVRHAFGTVDPIPLLPGIRFVSPWSEVERYSTREEQFPRAGDEAEKMDALSSEQMAMKVDAALRYQIDPAMAPRLFLEIGSQEQIDNVVRNAIRNGVRDGMVAFSINEVSQRNAIALMMENEVDSALLTRPRNGGEPFQIATVTAFYLRNLEPPPQVVQAINNKIAQEQQIETEKHRVEVARLQSDQQRLLNLTLTPEQLTKQYLEVLHDMKGSSNMIIMVPTEGGIPVLDVGALRKNIRE
jgi:regulator of protease activity HflC (stomatin/prohibitin superfamily)